MNNNNSKRTNMEANYSKNKLPAKLLSVNDVADFLGVHSGTIRRWEKKGLLKSYTIGLRHNLRFKQEDILNLLHTPRRSN